MGHTTRRGSKDGAWDLAARQHGVVSRRQLIQLGLSAGEIRTRLRNGRLHPLMRGVYSVGRPEVTRHGEWMAAVLCCDPRLPAALAGDSDQTHSAALSHRSAAALWGVSGDRRTPIEVTVLRAGPLNRPGLRVHRRQSLPAERLTMRDGIPLTEIVQTLADLAGVGRTSSTWLHDRALERIVDETDRLDLVDPERLLTQLADHRGEPGVARLRSLRDRQSFRLADSELERCFLELVRRARLPLPLTRQQLNGYRVDFYWPELGLVVETDGLRYHRTPGQQGRDRRRDRAQAAAGLITLRFTHWEVTRESDQVSKTVADTVARLRGPRETRARHSAS